MEQNAAILTQTNEQKNPHQPKKAKKEPQTHTQNQNKTPQNYQTQQTNQPTKNISSLILGYCQLCFTEVKG